MPTFFLYAKLRHFALPLLSLDKIGGGSAMPNLKTEFSFAIALAFRYLCIIMVYRSKIDAWLVLLVTVIVALSSVPVLMFAFSWVGLALVLVVLLVFADLIVNTKYIINGRELRVKSGSFMSEKYDIGAIVEIKDTRTILSAPAASLDRIQIKFNNRKVLIISPVKKAEFVARVMAINPEITVKSAK